MTNGTILYHFEESVYFFRVAFLFIPPVPPAAASPMPRPLSATAQV